MLDSDLNDIEIAVIGLGNIGLPLAIEFGKKYITTGFDIDIARVESLIKGVDLRNISKAPFVVPKFLQFVSNIEAIRYCNVYIVAVPTSVFPDGTPNIVLLKSISESIGLYLKKNDVVIYESTVFPGCTEDVCVPILEKQSGLKYNNDFFVGYSPERINTADNIHTLTETIKITSGSDTNTARKVDQLYRSIIEAGTYPVSSIKIAEAAKLLENAQRDVNIAFMNNVATILSSQNIPFDEVWDASSTKWNFIKFSPGLVGGECLPLASQYLNFGANDKDENILSISRKINDKFPQAIADLVVRELKKTFPDVLNPQILILGLSYKANTASVKGALVPKLVKALREYQLAPDVYDPVAENSEMTVVKTIEQKYHVIIKVINHQVYSSLDYSKITFTNCLIFDINKWSFKEIIL